MFGPPAGIVGEWREDGSRFCANAHLSDDKTVAKMGGTRRWWCGQIGPPIRGAARQGFRTQRVGLSANQEKPI
jgi:hypothetical protein